MPNVEALRDVEDEFGDEHQRILQRHIEERISGEHSQLFGREAALKAEDEARHQDVGDEAHQRNIEVGRVDVGARGRRLSVRLQSSGPILCLSALLKHFN